MAKIASAGADIHCGFCGTRNPATATICSQCGADLKEGKARQAGWPRDATRSRGSRREMHELRRGQPVHADDVREMRIAATARRGLAWPANRSCTWSILTRVLGWLIERRVQVFSIGAIGSAIAKEALTRGRVRRPAVPGLRTSRGRPGRWPRSSPHTARRSHPQSDAPGQAARRGADRSCFRPRYTCSGSPPC